MATRHLDLDPLIQAVDGYRAPGPMDVIAFFLAVAALGFGSFILLHVWPPLLASHLMVLESGHLLPKEANEITFGK